VPPADLWTYRGDATDDGVLTWLQPVTGAQQSSNWSRQTSRKTKSGSLWTPSPLDKYNYYHWSNSIG